MGTTSNRERAAQGKLAVIGLTARQAEVLRFIEAEIARQGYAPTVREIGRRFGWRSTNAVSDHLFALEGKGYIATAYGKRRTIRVLVSAPFLPPPREPTLFGQAPVLLHDGHSRLGGEALFWPIAASDPAEEAPALANAS